METTCFNQVVPTHDICYECFEHGTCEASQVRNIPQNCQQHHFVEDEPECTLEGFIVRYCFHCKHCGMLMTREARGIHKGIVLMGKGVL